MKENDSIIPYKEYSASHFWSNIVESKRDGNHYGIDFIIRPALDSKNWYICTDIQIYNINDKTDYHETFYYITNSDIPLIKKDNGHIPISKEILLNTIIEIIYKNIINLEIRIFNRNLYFDKSSRPSKSRIEDSCNYLLNKYIEFRLNQSQV